ncbi:MAG: Ribonuclease M5 [Candidatus Heimdallarchaeota archaeon AB_125]|nr:MAG: Ribonuclease M5 [Candidatus Heimdallarchaeota archaeon AB_125]
MTYQEEDFFQFINNLKNVVNSVIIVEGKNDQKALEFWNIQTPIEPITHPWFEFIDFIMNKYSKDVQIILLLDADPQGKEYVKKLKTEFRQFGYKVNTGFWIKIQRFHITCIEGLDSHHFRGLKQRYDLAYIDEKDKDEILDK